MLQTLKMMLLLKHKFIIPLDFECQVMQCPITNQDSETDHARNYFQRIWKVINATGQAAKPYAMYKIMDIALEYEVVTQPDIARRIPTE